MPLGDSRERCEEQTSLLRPRPAGQAPALLKRDNRTRRGGIALGDVDPLLAAPDYAMAAEVKSEAPTCKDACRDKGQSEMNGGVSPPLPPWCALVKGARQSKPSGCG